MVDKALWDKVGGFDRASRPATTRIRIFVLPSGGKASGTYQPAAGVLHFEGVSHGTDISEGAKANQARHQVTFAQKWQRELASHAPMVNGRIEADRGARARVLWLEPA